LHGVEAPAEENAPASFPVVRSVAFRVTSPYPVSYEELAALVTLRPGMPLAPEAVRESIRALYGKSSFASVEAYVREEHGGADLLFLLRPLPVIQEIEVVGARAAGANAVLAASRLRRGMPLAGRDLAEAERGVREALRRRGFVSAAVEVFAACSADTGGGRIRIQVREGSPAAVRRIEARGASFFGPGELEAHLGVRAGGRFDYQRFQEGVRRLRAAYKRAGFLAVRILEPEMACEEAGEICLVVPIEEGPRYRVVWRGNGAFSREELEKASGLYAEEEVTEGALIHDVRERLVAFYRKRGYYRAEVRVEAGEAGADGLRPLSIAVEEGPKGYVAQIRFEGNRGIPAKRLRERMATRRRGPFHVLTGSGRWAEETWADDLAAVIGLYQEEGYVRARIVSVDNVWDASGAIVFVVRVEEGPRYRLGAVLFRGNDHYLREELISLMANREGRFVDYLGLERDQEALAAHYRDAGYLDVRVQGRLSFDEERRTATAHFDISEGPRYRLGKVTVRGNVLTDAGAVLRELRVAPGEPVGEKALLAFQQAVFGTGLYRSVRVQRIKDPREGVLDLIVEVEETLFFEVEFGGGYGTDTGLRGFVGAKHKNLDGRGRAFTGRAAVSEKERTLLGELREPWIFGPRWKWEGALTASHQVAEKTSFGIRKTSVVTGISRTFFERSTFSLQYEMSRDRVFDVAPGAVIAPEDAGGANIAAVRALFVLDLRDDPFNPRRGSLQSGSAEYASFALGSEVDYLRATAQSSWYFPLLRRNTFAVSARGGWARPLHTTVEVPIQKRFFLGGRTTVRGFKEESLGPRGPDGAPVGGDYMVNGNAEVRVPLRYGFVAAAFLDAGSVWLRGNPAGRFDLRESAGLGLRYVTPIGPVSFDYAWKLDRRAGESGSDWHFTIGAVF